jgi:2-C-methyl-D-erythritol 4-phosphate cytidylyltransferase
MKVSAIVVAAGSGTRLGLATPKAFVTIANKPLLRRVLQTLSTVEVIDEVVIAVPADAQKIGRAEVDAARLQIPVKVMEGGAERQDSVRRALRLTSAEAELIVVHDAARPFATASMFSACIAAAAENGAAIVAIPVADTLKQAANGAIVGTVQRSGLWQAQTPQAFRRELLVQAHELGTRECITVTDDADLCERLGVTVRIVPGSVSNLKITTSDDLMLAEAIALLAPPR